MQTNNSGTVTGSNVFLPFGDLLSSTTSDMFQYTGLPQDTENSSVHATFRNLSTIQSRWLSPDPYNGSYDVTNPQSFNRDVYAIKNPLPYVDPQGWMNRDYRNAQTAIAGVSKGSDVTKYRLRLFLILSAAVLVCLMPRLAGLPPIAAA